MSENNTSWICLVCGYVHHGDSPPEVCPICGAPETDFEPHEATEHTSESAPQHWRCVICGYLHDGDSPPDHCPICAASSDDFEAVSDTSPSNEKSSETSKKKIIIVGGGIAGLSAAEHARKAAPTAEIHLYTNEKTPPYYRLNLTRYLADEINADALPVHPDSWYEEQGIALHCDKEIIAINPEAHTIQWSEEGSDNYDNLILACGAHPFIPPIPGAEKRGVTTVRTWDDASHLIDQIAQDTPCICIGGGILGLEVAGALAKRGAAVTLLETFDYLLPRQLTPDAAAVLEKEVTKLGISVKKQANTKAIGGNGQVAHVLLDSGEQLPAALVTITTGIRPNTHLARRAGLQVNNGIIVDAQLRTSMPDIFAAGDAAEWNGTIYGLWEPARFQGAIAGQNAAGATAEFGGIPRMNTLKVLGVDLFSIGVIAPEDGSYVEIVEESDGVYRRFLFHDNLLAGAILVGDTKITPAIVRAMKEDMDMSDLLAGRPNVKDVLSYLSNH